MRDRERFFCLLDNDKDRKLVEEIESLAHRADRRFFHWEIEFPEVFFGFIDADERQIKHKDQINAGAAGFNVIVGNPPYVRMELFKPIKHLLKDVYRCHADRADIFIYFHEKAALLTAKAGILRLHLFEQLDENCRLGKISDTC